MYLDRTLVTVLDVGGVMMHTRRQMYTATTIIIT
jgi:hypothetical protein